MITSMRRNLQRELVDRLIDLAQPGGDKSAAAKPISNLAMMHLRQLKKEIEGALKADAAVLDAYSKAHLEDAQMRITKALEAPFIFNARDLAPRPSFPFFFQPQPGQVCNDPNCSCARGGWDTRRD
jgi:hypothetical protein